MELEITEIVKEFRVTINADTLNIPVKARIVRYIGADECWFEISCYYKERGSIDFYRPGAGASSIKSAQDKLVSYLENFRVAIFTGGDYNANSSYID